MKYQWLGFVVLTLGLVAAPAQEQRTSTLWQASNPGFRPVSITSDGNSFWICGVGESIASSQDGRHWTLRHRGGLAGALLLGIHFSSDGFGYAYGTEGSLLTTSNGGSDWIARKVSDEPILMAALADPAHGLLRTRTEVLILSGDGPVHPIEYSADIEHRFKFTEGLAALTQDRMLILLSQGPYSEAGYLATEDGGKRWTFYDPPSMSISGLAAVGGDYWTTGLEVVGKDRPGGGLSVPMAMSSKDGLHWMRTTNDIIACHWENCGICTGSGCLASSTLLVNFFNQGTTYDSIPPGELTAQWASAHGMICTINNGVFCASMTPSTDAKAQPEFPKPTQPTLAPLGASSAKSGILRCLSCSLEPVYVDERVHGRFKLHLGLHVREDGTMAAVEIGGAPSSGIEEKLRQQMLQWLFEPPQKDSKHVRVDSKTDVDINVVQSR